MNVLGWMLHSAMVVGLLVGSGLVLERAFALYRHPVRGIWVAAILLGFAIPAAAYLELPLPGAGYDIAPVALGQSIGEIRSMGRSADAANAGVFGRIDALLLAIWIAGSIGTLAHLIRSALALRSHTRHCARMEIAGRPVTVSESLGPGVSSLLASGIVIPRALLAMDDHLKRLIVLHEEEHLRARDHRLLMLGLAALVLSPWNPFVWWSVRRLRLAIEIDCDARVLEKGIPAASYAEALVAVAECRMAAPPMAAAFTYGRSQLERRVRAMLPKTNRFRAATAIAACACAAVLLGLACDSTAPSDPEDAASAAMDAVQGSNDAAAMAAPDRSEDLEGEPSSARISGFTPFTERPELIDPEAAARTVEASYPELLRNAGIGGTVHMWLYVDREGRVEEVRLETSSGDDRLDSAALRAARQFRLRPARNGEEVVPVWIQVPITYEP